MINQYLFTYSFGRPTANQKQVHKPLVNKGSLKDYRSHQLTRRFNDQIKASVENVQTKNIDEKAFKYDSQPLFTTTQANNNGRNNKVASSVIQQENDLIQVQRLTEQQLQAQKVYESMKTLQRKDFDHIFEKQNGGKQNSFYQWFNSWFEMPPPLETGIAMEAFAKVKHPDDLKSQALNYHQYPKPGKYEIKPTKQMRDAQDLTLAYSPGVAEPCIEIQKDPNAAYKYTGKGNMVAVISNGTAVLGLGNIGALASKPVMEGKSVLLNKFGGVNSIDICIREENPDEFIRVVKQLAPSFGGINLEDIKGPECFYIEDMLKKEMNIPVFHDDQHGTAIVCLAGLINALKLQNKKIEDVKIVLNGAGAAGIACMKLIRRYGANPVNCILCDSRGVIYQGRENGMNCIKQQFAVDTNQRTLEEACEGADVLIGVSQPDKFTDKMILSLAPNPIIFAMANPVPEITPQNAKALRDDVIIATGRSDYPNQINNVMCFPFLFRAALDTRSTKINEAMKIATAKKLAELAQQKSEFGKDYIIPTPFDKRLIIELPVAIAKAAVESGAATIDIADFDAYKQELSKIAEADN